jgi:hypothetical protein
MKKNSLKKQRKKEKKTERLPFHCGLYCAVDNVKKKKTA